ncbi:MAG: alpha-1,4-glucan--maltose-1-phosphate maltosyltransferase, partial [Elusimicrobiota bacterium]
MQAAASVPQRHIIIEDVTPSIDAGRYPVKRLQGEECRVTAHIFRDGHELIKAVVRWRRQGQDGDVQVPMHCDNPGLDFWQAGFPLQQPGLYEFTVEAWTDHYASWLQGFSKRVAAHQSEAVSEAAEGLRLIKGNAAAAKHDAKKRMQAYITRLEACGAGMESFLSIASEGQLLSLMGQLDDRSDAVTWEPRLQVIVETAKAAFGSWYEFFVRSQGTVPGKGATFKDAAKRLSDVAGMGFDVLYLAPIHPIGVSFRKGRNNALLCTPQDPGSPWAIGSAAGGHMAIEPALGTLADFDAFVLQAKKLGIDIALDLALQCSPDHPWVKEHPEWFYKRPDGTIRYAENPPKKYQDIYPLNFDSPDAASLWQEILRVVSFWVGHGVGIFRVDNPHTKPLAFWRWLIAEVKSRHPHVLFLAEAFTKPHMMYALGKVGFSQSYTYFTWRNSKDEIESYLKELSSPSIKDIFRPNFFVNTPDILPHILQKGGPAAFKMRLILAATLAGSYGIYSGFELCESAALPDSEEYLD